MSALLSSIWQEIVATLVVTVVSILTMRFLYPRLREMVKVLTILRDMGLKDFLPSDRFAELGVFDVVVGKAEAGDEVLIVARTARWLLEQRRAAIMGGLKKGVYFRLLLLSPQRLRQGSIPLSLCNSKTLSPSFTILTCPCDTSLLSVRKLDNTNTLVCWK